MAPDRKSFHAGSFRAPRIALTGLTHPNRYYGSRRLTPRGRGLPAVRCDSKDAHVGKGGWFLHRFQAVTGARVSPSLRHLHLPQQLARSSLRWYATGSPALKDGLPPGPLFVRNPAPSLTPVYKRNVRNKALLSDGPSISRPILSDIITALAETAGASRDHGSRHVGPHEIALWSHGEYGQLEVGRDPGGPRPQPPIGERGQ